MLTRPAPSRLLVGGTAVLVLLTVPGATRAQPPTAAPKPVVEQARIAVSMADGGADAVEATYKVRNTAGLKDNVVEHLLMRRPGTEVADIQASGDAAGSPTLQPRAGISRVRVTVSGDPATYTLRYAVRRAPGRYAIPILTPGIPVAKSALNVTIETALPPGTKPEGEWFPSVERVETRDGRTVLIQRVINVPSVAIAEYGQGRLWSRGLVLTLLALALMAVVFVWWFREALARRPTAGRA